MSDWRLNAVAVPFVVASVALVVWLASGDGLVERDGPLPDLPITMLDGSAVPADVFGGRPGVINVWLPG